MSGAPQQDTTQKDKDEALSIKGEDKMIKPQNISEPIKVLIGTSGLIRGFIIPCQFFKPSGKWYMDEDVIIPLDTPVYNIHSAIKEYRRIGTFVTTGLDLRGVPFLVPADK